MVSWWGRRPRTRTGLLLNYLRTSQLNNLLNPTSMSQWESPLRSHNLSIRLLRLWRFWGSREEKSQDRSYKTTSVHLYLIARRKPRVIKRKKAAGNILLSSKIKSKTFKITSQRRNLLLSSQKISEQILRWAVEADAISASVTLLQ
jgi:hypothetical protein